MQHITDCHRITGVVMAVLGLALAGAVYGQTVEQAKLKAADAGASDQFANSMSMDGDRLAVGAHLDDDNGVDAGAVYVFTWDGTSWVEQAKLTASDGTAGNDFGVRVSLDGDRLLVGAQNESAAYVFHWNETSGIWEEKAKLTAWDAPLTGYFGHDVSIDGDLLAVGAYAMSDSRGAVYVFTWDGANWVQQAKLTALWPLT